MHMSAKLVRRSCPIDVLRHVFKQRRVENDRSHSTGMTRSLGLHGFPSSTYTHSKIKHIKMKGHAYKIWGAIARSSPCHATPLLLPPQSTTASASPDLVNRNNVTCLSSCKETSSSISQDETDRQNHCLCMLKLHEQ